MSQGKGKVPNGNVNWIAGVIAQTSCGLVAIGGSAGQLRIFYPDGSVSAICEGMDTAEALALRFCYGEKTLAQELEEEENVNAKAHANHT